MEHKFSIRRLNPTSGPADCATCQAHNYGPVGPSPERYVRDIYEVRIDKTVTHLCRGCMQGLAHVINGLVDEERIQRNFPECQRVLLGTILDGFGNRPSPSADFDQYAAQCRRMCELIGAMPDKSTQTALLRNYGFDEKDMPAIQDIPMTESQKEKLVLQAMDWLMEPGRTLYIASGATDITPFLPMPPSDSQGRQDAMDWLRRNCLYTAADIATLTDDGIMSMPGASPKTISLLYSIREEILKDGGADANDSPDG